MLVSRVVPLVVIFVSGAWAQFEMAQCPSGFDWNKNSLGQDPCTVGSMLDASCRGLAEYTYPPLNASQYYLPPRANHSGDVECDCNTVMYSLYMACSSCQGGTVYPWIQWVPQCPSVYISQYPVEIAQGTAVPYWAYFNVTTLPSQNWTEVNAMTVGRDPEELPPQINTVATGSSGSGRNTISRTSTGFAGPTGDANPNGGTNVGAIVGGVVGSVVPLTILAIVAFLYVRNRKQKAAAAQASQYAGMPPADDDPYNHRPVSYPMPSSPLVQYDPSDPSTFPPQSPPVSVTYTTQPVNARGAYSGMPEV